MNLRHSISILSLALAFAVPAAAHADTVYDVTGTFNGVGGPALGGTYTISSAGVVTGADLTLDGLTFNILNGSSAPNSAYNFSLVTVDTLTNSTDYVQLAIYNLGTVCSIGNEPCEVTVAPGVSFPDFSVGLVTPGPQLNLVSASASPETAATPEPSSLALLGTGFAGAFALARRRFFKV
jgi:hypothetical protein